MTLATFIQASAHQLDGIADGSVQAVVTSPPYYGLRAYAGEQGVEWPAVEYAPMPGLPPIRIAGCGPGCEHEWQDGPATDCGRRDGKSRAAIDGYERNIPGERGTNSEKVIRGAYCSRCGGWRGGLGNEPTLEAYIGHLILCLREWRRVLRDDGVCFVNLGDSYASYRDGKYPPQTVHNGAQHDMPTSGSPTRNGPMLKAQGIKHKDLMMVPARFALAAQADGWWLRSDIIGHKIAPMPESVTDRPTRSHEHIFMLTKSARYYWDAEGVKEEGKDWGGRKREIGEYFTNGVMPNGAAHHGLRDGNFSEKGRNMRDVIEWRPSPFPGAHFAVWPEAIPEKLIRAATRPGDTVLDPFSGSGTTAKVAVKLGRKAIGVDIAAEYLNEVTSLRFGEGVQMELVSA